MAFTSEPAASAVLATRGNLVFTGTAEGYLKAFDAKTGKAFHERVKVLDRVEHRAEDFEHLLLRRDGEVLRAVAGDEDALDARLDLLHRRGPRHQPLRSV